jgi:hypothetical protein
MTAAFDLIAAAGNVSCRRRRPPERRGKIELRSAMSKLVRQRDHLFAVAVDQREFQDMEAEDRGLDGEGDGLRRLAVVVVIWAILAYRTVRNFGYTKVAPGGINPNRHQT